MSIQLRALFECVCVCVDITSVPQRRPPLLSLEDTILFANNFVCSHRIRMCDLFIRIDFSNTLLIILRVDASFVLSLSSTSIDGIKRTARNRLICTTKACLSIKIYIRILKIGLDLFLLNGALVTLFLFRG